MEKPDLPEKAKVRITISENFSRLLNEVGEIEAKEDIGRVLEDMRIRAYYEQSCFGYFCHRIETKHELTAELLRD